MIAVYSSDSCPYCTMVKNYFKSKNIPFTEYNVARDPRKADEMIRKSGQMGVPVVDINGKVIVGFRPSDIDTALRR